MEKVLLQIEGVNSVSLLNEFSKLMDAKLVKLVQVPPVENDMYISRQQVADMFSITLPTVHAWMNAGVLKPYKIGSKTRFLLREVKAAAIGINQKREVSNAR